MFKNSAYHKTIDAVQPVREGQLSHFRSAKPAFTLEGMNQFALGHSFEVCHPFMDIRLVEYCLGLPSEQSFQNGWSRIILRRAMKGVLPETVRLRHGKATAEEVSKHWLLTVDAARLEQLISQADVLAPYVDLHAVHGMYHRATTRQAFSSSIEKTQLGLVASVVYWMKNVRGAQQNTTMSVAEEGAEGP